MDIQNDFYVSLFSDNSFEYFPNNNSSLFQNKLFTPITFSDGLFEIGLCQITYHEPSVKPITPTPPSPVSPKKFDLFFPNTGDNVVTVYTYSEAEFHIKKISSGDMSAFNVHMNNIFIEFKVPARFTEIYDGQDEPTMKLYWNDATRTFRIQQDIADALGFDQLDFTMGEYKAKRRRNPQPYLDLPNDHTFVFICWKWIPTTVNVVEPSKYEFEYLLHAIIDALDSHDHEIGLIQSKSGDILFVKLKDPRKQIKFSKKINSILGVDENYIFSQLSTTLYLPKETIAIGQPDDIIVPDQNPITNRNQIYVICNVIENQFVGSTSLPVLRILQRTNQTNVEISNIFTPVFYMTLKDSHVSYIQLSLINEKFELLEKTSFPTTAILHVRKKQYEAKSDLQRSSMFFR